MMVDKKKIISTFRASLSTSYIIKKNNNEQNINSILFLSNADYYYKTTAKKFNQSVNFKSDAGYAKQSDSIWTKYTDNWRLNWSMNELSSRTFSHAYLLSIKSQWLNNWRYVRVDNELYSRQWRSGFMNPASLTFSYNITKSFWQNSTVMLGLTSIRANIKPRYKGAIEPANSPFAATSHSWIMLNFGLSGQVFIFRKKISETVDWDNTSQFFINGVSKDQVTFDIQNRISIKFLKYLQFRIDSHILYDPLINYKMQLDQQFLLGVFYEKRKSN